MKKEYLKEWMYRASVRALKTMMQSGIAVIGSATVLSQVDAGIVASTMVLSAVLSFMTSIVGLPEVEVFTEENEEE